MTHIISAIIFLLTSATLTAFASTSVMNTGEILPAGQFRFNAETQFLTTGTSLSTNIISHLDFGVNEDSDIRLEIGAGATGYQFGAKYKWIPIPNYRTQPAVGSIFGMNYSNNDSKRSFRFSASPLISQRLLLLDLESIIYAALPMGVLSSHKSSDIFFQLSLGSELKIRKFKNITFNTEVGLNLYKASSYVSVGANFYFDRPRF